MCQIDDAESLTCDDTQINDSGGGKRKNSLFDGEKYKTKWFWVHLVWIK